MQVLQLMILVSLKLMDWNPVDALKERIQPKLQALGEHFSPQLSVMTGDEMHPHVEKHARRTVNPPNDTWVVRKI